MKLVEKLGNQFFLSHFFKKKMFFYLIQWIPWKPKCCFFFLSALETLLLLIDSWWIWQLFVFWADQWDDNYPVTMAILFYWLAVTDLQYWILFGIFILRCLYHSYEKE
jgi:hypothetical protein